jgi:predicted NAD/FAD-dependent oxidoreductase
MVVPNRVDTAIVGGGLAGLTAAMVLAQAGQHVAVFEKSNEFGGRARTDRHHGFTFNLGPPNRSFGRPALSDALPFTSLYLLADGWAAEIANRTVHGVMHVGWVPDDAGGYRGQMAVLVKPNGLFGTAYMAAIRPFRHLIVYPPAMRQIEREWWARRAKGK